MLGLLGCPESQSNQSARAPALGLLTEGTWFCARIGSTKQFPDADKVEVAEQDGKGHIDPQSSEIPVNRALETRCPE